MERYWEGRVTIGDLSDWRKLTRSRLNAKLLLACTVRNLSVAQKAIEHGANVNCRRPDFLTPLHVATEYGDVELVRFICSVSNVRLEAKTMHGLTPLHIAALLGHIEIIIELFKSGATLNSVDNLGRTPLYYAVLQNNVDCARSLMRSGALVHAYDVFQESPLYIGALKNKDVHMIKLLLGDPQCPIAFPPKDSGRILLEAVLSARTKYDIEIVKTILHYGGDIVNISDPLSWQTPLHVVALTGYYELAEYLVENGANLHARNRAKQTAFQVALNCKHLNIVRLLDKRLRATGNEDVGDES